MLIIVGEQGAGKSLLLKRLEERLLLQEKIAKKIYRLRGGRRAEDLREVKGAKKAGRHKYIFVDDIFRFGGMDEFLEEPGMPADAVIIGASTLHELRLLPAECPLIPLTVKDAAQKNDWPLLADFSDAELAQLARLRPSYPKISDDLWEKIIAPKPPTLVLMMQLEGGGADFHNIVIDKAKNLLGGNEPSDPAAPMRFRTYCAVSAFYRLGLVVPKSVLVALLGADCRNFVDELEKDCRKGTNIAKMDGLVRIENDARFAERCFAARHEFIAQTLARPGERNDYSGAVRRYSDKNLLDALDKNNPAHQRFAALFYLTAIRADAEKFPRMQEKASQHLRENESAVDAFVAANSENGAFWAQVWRRLGENKKAVALLKSAQSTDSYGIVRLIHSLIYCKEPHLAADKAHEFLQKYPTNNYFWMAYLPAAWGSGDKNIIAAAFNAADEWRKNNPANFDCWKVYLAAARHSGDKNIIAAAFNAADEWRKNNPADSHFWSAYLTVARDSGDKNIIAAALNAADEWHKKTSSDPHFWTAYLPVAQHSGDKNIIAAALNAADEWHKNNPANSHFWSAYLTVARDSGDKNIIAAALNAADEWCKNNPTGSNFWSAYLTVARYSGDKNIIADALEKAPVLAAKYQSNDFIQTAYWALAAAKGSEAQVQKALAAAKEWLGKNFANAATLQKYQQLEERAGAEKDAGPRAAAGIVKWYNPDKGFGFIKVDGGGPDCFFHCSEISGGEVPASGERVSFFIAKSAKSPIAKKVAKVGGGRRGEAA